MTRKIGDTIVNTKVNALTITLFEQPLNERTRTLLRLEFLFRQAEHYRSSDSDWGHRNALSTLIELCDLLLRGDLKSEVIKELDASSATLAKLADTPGVDPKLLTEISSQVLRLSEGLLNGPLQLGSHIKVIDLLNAVNQRSSIPGGTCAFDVPALHSWLQQDPAVRTAEIDTWYAPLNNMRDAVDLVLQMLRSSKDPSDEVAVDGSFHRNLNRDKPSPLVRVELASDLLMFPEISGGRHGLAIRFMQQRDASDRASQVSDDIQFTLTCCGF